MMKDKTKSRRKFLRQTTQGALGTGAVLTAGQWKKVLGANDRIRLGIIGTGNRGQDVMASFMKQTDVEVAALSDAYDKYMNEAMEKVVKAGTTPKTYAEYRDMLADKNIDIVFIATPDHWHAQMAIDTCKAGKDIYIEKPLTFSIEEGHKIIKAVKDANRIMQVG